MAREQRILDLKKEANELAQAAGKPAPYGSLDRIEKDEALDNLVQTMKDRDAVSGGEPEELEVADLLNVEDLQTLLATSAMRSGLPQPYQTSKATCWHSQTFGELAPNSIGLAKFPLNAVPKATRYWAPDSRKVRISPFINAKMA